MTKKTRLVLVLVIAAICVTATSIVVGKLISGWGEQSDDDPWRKK
jgi:hypothetical protein